MTPALTGKQKRYLRALAHALKPIIHVGKAGITETLCQQAEANLLQHELIKVKILEACPTDKKTCSAELTRYTHAQEVQMIGRTLVLYRPHPEEPVIVLP